jgi:hypothetical protein
MRIAVPPNKKELLSLSFGMWGLGGITFRSYLKCKLLENGERECFQDTCEGDFLAARLMPTTGGDILLEASGVGADMDELSLIHGNRRHQYPLRGVFLVKKQSAGDCGDVDSAGKAEIHTISLRPGDVGVPVHMVEQALSKLGFSATPPDFVYTSDTERAVTAFQHSIGLPETGIVDSATWKQLSLLALIGSGGMC